MKRFWDFVQVSVAALILATTCFFYSQSFAAVVMVLDTDDCPPAEPEGWNCNATEQEQEAGSHFVYPCGPRDKPFKIGSICDVPTSTTGTLKMSVYDDQQTPPFVHFKTLSLGTGNNIETTATFNAGCETNPADKVPHNNNGYTISFELIDDDGNVVICEAVGEYDHDGNLPY